MIFYLLTLLCFPGKLDSSEGKTIIFEGDKDIRYRYYQIHLDTTASYLYSSMNKDTTYLFWSGGEWVIGNQSILQISE